ncbi:WAT1-related protein At2g37460-like [Trifolium pratense]|nr:WAT1-related protein At2g37460-like [Trifolium pratense]
MNILMKLAINNGISNYVFVVYRNGVASLFRGPIGFFVDSNIRPAMTSRIFGKIIVLSLLGIILDQNLYYAGMKLTTPTFATVLSNTIPTITFVLAIIFRMEHLIIRNRLSQAKVVGTLVTLTGAMIMTLVKGHVLYGSGGANSHHHQGGGISLLGTVYLLLGCLSTASSTIFSKCAFNNPEIPCSDNYSELSITALVCLFGTIEGIIVAFIMEERFHGTLWNYFKWDMLLLTALYSGIFCSGLGYFLRLKVIKARDANFSSTFGPINMVMVMVASTFLFGNLLSLGSVIGSMIISMGLLCVLWGNAHSRPAAQ